MRKIEREMLQAIHEHRHWQKDNTRVAHMGGDVFNVYLHSNPIAYIKGGKVWPNLETWNRWPTMTTGSRLHALGVPNKASRDGDPGRARLSRGPHRLRPADANA